MSLPSHMSTLGSLKPSDPVVTSVPSADWNESDSDSPSFVANKPTAMRSPAALSFGQKTYDGSAAQTLTAADLGALTAHQDISGKVDSSALFSGGKVKAELLPSYVDDVLEYPSSAGFPSAGEAGKIYVAKDTNKTYRWSGTQYVEVSPAPDLSNYVQKEAGKGLFSGLYNDLSGKPTIPAALTVDSALSDTSENPVQNKVVTAALAEKLTRAEAEAGFTEWTVGGVPTGYSVDQMPYYSENNDRWELHLVYEPQGEGEGVVFSDSDPDSVDLSFTGQLNYASDVHITATRTRLPTMADIPTDNAQLANGAGYATTAAMNAALAGKADAASLPYALVGMQLSAWMYSWPEGADGALFEAQYSNGAWIFSNPDNSPISVTAAEDAMSLTFTASDVNGTSYAVTATRGYQLTDRAINAVSLTAAAATLTMPAVSVAGHARDLVVRLVVGADGLNITWGTADAGGVAVDYETEDGNFPDLSAAGTYLVRLAETAAFAAGTGGAADVPAKFLIQCQPLQTAATQGGGQ